MNEEVFNLSIRKFLKKVGINSQREIEQTVRELIAEGKLKGNESLHVGATFTLAGRENAWTIEDEIKLDQ